LGGATCIVLLTTFPAHPNELQTRFPAVIQALGIHPLRGPRLGLRAPNLREGVS
jgi:hypothetical protein